MICIKKKLNIYAYKPVHPYLHLLVLEVLPKSQENVPWSLHISVHQQTSLSSGIFAVKGEN